MTSNEVHRSWVERASQGDAEALDALLERHLPSLLTYVRLHAGQLVLNKESSADLVQSVCREVLSSNLQFEYRGEPAFRKWLFTTALNKIRERYRYYQAEKRTPKREAKLADSQAPLDLGAILPSFTTPSQVAIRAEDMARLEKAFQSLPGPYQQVITLTKVVGMPHAEVALEMDRSEGAVRVLLHRALFQLGLALDRLDHEQA